MSPFPRANAVPLLKRQWWDLRGTEPLGFGGTKQGSIPGRRLGRKYQKSLESLVGGCGAEVAQPVAACPRMEGWEQGLPRERCAWGGGM